MIFPQKTAQTSHDFDFMGNKKPPEPQASPVQLNLFSWTLPEVEPPAQTARASFRGYLYQLRYAANLALELTPNQVLGFELIDDINVMSADGINSIIQVKDEKASLSDMSRGFWKALSHWATDAERDVNYFDRVSHLIFATTAPISPDSFPEFMTTETDCKKRVERAKQIKDSTTAELQACISRVRDLPMATLSKLLSKVNVVKEKDAASVGEEIRAKFRSKTFPDNRLDDALHEWEGWMVNEVLTAFEAGKGAQINEQSVRDELQRMRDQINSDPIPFRHAETAFDARTLEHCRDKTFIRQVEIINFDSKQIKDALLDYLRNGNERTDWARSQEVGQEALRKFNIELQARWRHRFEDIGADRKGLDEVAWGRKLYSEVIGKERPLLQNHEAPAHVIRGSYHALADEGSHQSPRIGWHPRWESMFVRPSSK